MAHKIHSIQLYIDHFVPQPLAIFLAAWRLDAHRRSSPYWWKIETSSFGRLQLNQSSHRLKSFKETGTNGNSMVPNQKSMVGAVRHPIQALKVSDKWPYLIVFCHYRGGIQHLSYSPTLVVCAWYGTIQLVQLTPVHVWIDGLVVR